MRLHVWVKSSHRLPIISRRILHSKWWILRSPMPNEHPEIHYKSRRVLGANQWGKNFSPSGSREFPSFWNLYSKSTASCANFATMWLVKFFPFAPACRDHQNRDFNSSHPPQSFLDPSIVTQSSSPQMAAENHTTFLSLCVCGLTNRPIMYKKLDNTWAAGHQEGNTLLNFRQINKPSLNLNRLCVFKQWKRLTCRKV